MFERFTDRARKVMALANQEAQRLGHEFIGSEHILLGLVKEGFGVGASVLRNLGIDPEKVRAEVSRLVRSGEENLTIGRLPQTPRARKVIEYAIREARGFNHNYVGTEHILLGLLREADGIGAQILVNLGLHLEAVREEVLNLLGAGSLAGDLETNLRDEGWVSIGRDRWQRLCDSAAPSGKNPADLVRELIDRFLAEQGNEA